MATKVVQPKRKSELGELGAIGDIVKGGMRVFGGDPTGAIDVAQGAESLNATPQPDSIPDTAAQRALGAPAPTPEVEDPETAIRNAQVALARMPQPIQEEFAGALQMGQRAFQQKRESKV